MPTLYALLNADTKAWWYHRELRAHGRPTEARYRERLSIRENVRMWRCAHHLTFASGGHTVHFTPGPPYGACTCQGYERPGETAEQIADLLNVPIIDWTPIPDHYWTAMLRLPMVAYWCPPDPPPYTSLSYAPLSYVAEQARTLGARTVRC